MLNFHAVILNAQYWSFQIFRNSQSKSPRSTRWDFFKSKCRFLICYTLRPLILKMKQFWPCKSFEAVILDKSIRFSQNRCRFVNKGHLSASNLNWKKRWKASEWSDKCAFFHHFFSTSIQRKSSSKSPPGQYELTAFHWTTCVIQTIQYSSLATCKTFRICWIVSLQLVEKLV